MGIDGRPMVQGPFVGQEPVPSHDGAGPYRHNAVTPVEIMDEKRRQRKGMQFCARLLFRAGNFVGEPVMKFKDEVGRSQSWMTA